MPDHLAVRKIIAAHGARGADDQLCGLPVLHNNRCAPTGRFIAGLAPARFAGALVERDDEGVAFVIPIDYHGVEMHDG